jgi:hypothetical protein
MGLQFVAYWHEADEVIRIFLLPIWPVLFQMERVASCERIVH